MEGGCMLNKKPNWVNASTIMLTAGVWYSIFTNGFIVTLLWLIVIAAIIGISINIKDRRI